MYNGFTRSNLGLSLWPNKLLTLFIFTMCPGPKEWKHTNVKHESACLQYMWVRKQLITWAWRRSSSSCSHWWRRSGSGRGWAAARCCRASWCSWRPCRNPAPLYSARSTGWPMICCGGGRRERKGGEEEEGKVRGKEEHGEGGWVEGWGRTGGVRKSCRITVATLTPHSPDQSRQVGRRDEAAPRREEETHCWTNADGRTDRRRRWGDGGMGRKATYSLCAPVCEAYMWLTLEETRGAASSTEEERRKETEEFG